LHEKSIEKVNLQMKGGYTVTVPTLPGCISEGETIEEALGNIQDAIQGYLAVLAKHKRVIPIRTL
jgi:predicted RNase H-like HicB family nuclease